MWGTAGLYGVVEQRTGRRQGVSTWRQESHRAEEWSSESRRGCADLPCRKVPRDRGLRGIPVTRLVNRLEGWEVRYVLTGKNSDETRSLKPAGPLGTEKGKGHSSYDVWRETGSVQHERPVYATLLARPELMNGGDEAQEHVGLCPRVPLRWS
jgi:hypothetical protein